MNWILSPYYNNNEYKKIKCKYGGIIITLNSNNQLKNPINLDGSHHCCYEYRTKR